MYEIDKILFFLILNDIKIEILLKRSNYIQYIDIIAYKLENTKKEKDREHEKKEVLK